MKIHDSHGSARKLTSLLASGGEGGIYPLADRADVLVKIYHPEVLPGEGTPEAAQTLNVTRPLITPPPLWGWDYLEI